MLLYIYPYLFRATKKTTNEYLDMQVHAPIYIHHIYLYAYIYKGEGCLTLKLTRSL